MKHYLSILLFFISLNILAQENISKIKTNWFDIAGNWILTISDHTIIYKNQFWEYKTESITNERITLHMSNGVKFKNLSLSIIDSSNIEISFDFKSEPILLSKHQNIEVPIQNNKVNFQPDLVTINGYVKNSNQYYEFNNLKFGFGNWLTGNYKELFTEIDSSGFFSITFLQPYPEEFSISYRNKWIRLFMVPGETITVFLDADEFPNNILTMSRHADLAYNIAEFEKYSGSRVSKNSRIEQKQSQLLNAKAYKTWRDSLKLEDLHYASEYISKNNCSDFFKKWLFDKYKYNYITDVIENYTNERYKNKSEPFDVFYLSLVDSIDFSDSSGIANDALYSVINRFNNLYYNLASTRPETMGATKYFSDQGKSNPKISISSSEIKPVPERTLISKQEAVSVDEYIKEVNNVKNELIRDALIANCYNRFEGYYNSDSLAFKLFSNFKTDVVKDRFYEEYIKEKQLKGELNLVNLAVNEGQTLLSQIIEKHKNKVLYVDFWGTYCGPCLSEFESVKKLKKYYLNKNIVFVYLCERNKKSWQETIDKYNVIGDHYLLNNREYVGLAKMFNLTYVPRYILIDKNGKVVNYNAPRPLPWNELELKQLINKYL
jgi:thiol-disulfide isomerase/thioredoxin